MKLGKLQLNTPVMLAPMAGCADRAFREICISMGADACVGELCSAKGVYFKDKKSEQLLFVDKNERPKGVQLFGSDIEAMVCAAKTALKYEPDFIDINMGCPAPKVIASGGGSALLNTPQTAQKIVSEVKKVIDVPLTCKMRIGVSPDENIAVEFAKGLERAGADLITVHGRYAKQMYSGFADRQTIKEVKAAVSIPVIANGDITNGASAKEMLDITGADGIMIGRAALGNPFIFAQVKKYLQTGETLPAPTFAQKLEVLQKQFELSIKYKPEKVAMLEIRKHCAWYLKGVWGAAALKTECFSMNTKEDFAAFMSKLKGLEHI